MEYNFYPVSGQQIQFRIKAPNDAHIALTTGPYEGDPMWEVFIGGWGNTKSVIRKNRTKPDVVEVPTPGFLTNDDFRGFWIRWNDGNVTVGKENDPEPFMSYADPEPFAISHFGVCTGWGASGEWLLEVGPAGEGPTPSAPNPDLLSTDLWVDASSGAVPPNALEGGEDGEPLFVGRAEHEGALIPGKIKSSHGVCYIPWGGLEHSKANYQVLCSTDAKWMPASNKDIPPTAIPGGQTETGEVLFVGRVNYEGTLTIGKVQPSHGCIYIPFGGMELSFNDYEVLVS